MANERLRIALISSDYGIQGAADRLSVDRKTVERWIAGRNPHLKSQFALAELLGLDVDYLWPESTSTEAANVAGEAELITLYPSRAAVPAGLWHELFDRAQDRLDILVYAGFWLSEDEAFHELVEKKSNEGIPIRILLGDPDCPAVRQRSIDEGIDEAITSKIRNVLTNYRGISQLANVNIRLHQTVLYNSLFRSDSDLLVTSHVYGAPAYKAPVLHLRRLPTAPMFATYMTSFEKVWQDASPYSPTGKDRSDAEAGLLR